MKKSELLEIIKEEIENTIKEFDYSDPVSSGAHANLQTRLKIGDPKEIQKAAAFVKSVGASQGAAAAALTAVLGLPAAVLPAETAMVNAATQVFRAIPSGTARKSLYNAAIRAFKAEKLGTKSEAFRQFLSQAGKYAFPK